jgi:beta-mannosidase
MGALFWQINDCWPVASWASIDYFGRWKALHYFAKRFFAPMLVTGVEDIERGTVQVYVTSDEGTDQPGQLSWMLSDVSGKTIDSGSCEITVSGRKSQHVETLDLLRQVKAHGSRSVLLWLTLSVGGKVVSTNVVTFARPKHLELSDPAFTANVRQDGQNFTVSLSVERPALYAWLSLSKLDAQFSDNFFDIAPGQPVEITISGLPSGTSLADVQSQLQLNSLIDTYR